MVEFTEQPRRMAGLALVSRAINLILPRRIALLDKVPGPSPTRVIVGGDAAPELVMLPTDWDGLDAAADLERETRQRDVRLAQVKADGINAAYIAGTIVSGRDGGPLDCALHCQPGLARLEAACGKRMVFMGEYVAIDGFNATLAEHRRGSGEGVFWLYDAVPHEAWVTGQPYTVPIEVRLMALRETLADADAGLFVGMLDFWRLDAGELRAKAHEVWAAGFEGLVSKALGSPYERRRSKDWRKVKQRHRSLCQVVDVAVKDGRVHRVIVRGPSETGSKPLTVARGWGDYDAAKIMAAIANHKTEYLVADIEFELTVGATRSIRGATWKGLTA